MKKIFFLILTIISVIFFSCKEKSIKKQTDQGTINETEVEEKNNKSLIITENSFLGLKIGDSINLKSKNIKKETQENGEGFFPGYVLLDDNGKKIAFIFPKHKTDNIIGRIEISAPNYKTKEGISIGSTYEDLKKYYPNLETHGSEIESRTNSRVGGLSFLLDTYFGTYEIDESKIKPSTKIKRISIRGTKN
ncbi:hypothetical protein MPF19_17845 [Polaribacter sp. Z014]|uniref:hypothetical protein n=1 Tax=Polaribacter sp. Z014 TaxID=2927126 RepID=UPI00202262D3|nr:hypothetical protein [Polaribacter sp. Z014]MCL7765289.1 hypothetical protein [Polaribacter sp. Z014]